jgi:hypothetical protein
MPSTHPQRSLRHEYELYVEDEIEKYKDALPRSALLGIGDEAAKALAADQQIGPKASPVIVVPSLAAAADQAAR